MDVCSQIFINKNNMAMNVTSIEKSKGSLKKYVLSTLATGFGMWIVGGIYHNLILPTINEKIQPHHEGLAITLIAYFILAILMVYIFEKVNLEMGSFYDGLRLGASIGVLWVFPHGLAMAGTHQTSIIYEVGNMLYHVVEQGIGGIILVYVSKITNSKKP